MPSVEAQLWQQLRQKLFSEAVITAAEQSAHSMTGCQPHLRSDSAAELTVLHLSVSNMLGGKVT